MTQTEFIVVTGQNKENFELQVNLHLKKQFKLHGPAIYAPKGDMMDMWKWAQPMVKTAKVDDNL